MLTDKHLFTLMALRTQSNTFPLEGYVVDFLTQKGLVHQGRVTTRGRNLLDRMKSQFNESLGEYEQCLTTERFVAAA